jgi:hypothetical protein
LSTLEMAGGFQHNKLTIDHERNIEALPVTHQLHHWHIWSMRY